MRHSVLIPAMMAAIVLGAAVPAAAQTLTVSTVSTLTGVLVENACYVAMGSRASAVEHAKCAITCAQKGARLALVTATGDVYMVIGAYTQSNNAKLIPMLNKAVVMTGTVGARVLDSAVPILVVKSDSRRPAGSQDGVVAVKQVRKGDFREGDVPEVAEMTIDAASVDLAPVKLQ
jgi:hypothetical protein